MDVQSILLDGSSKISVILLANVMNDEQIFPIVTGLPAGEKIAGIIKNRRCISQLTHDLLMDIIQALQGKVEKVVIDKDSNEEVVSIIHLSRQSEKIFIEVQACDALTIALTSQAPMYARKSQLLTLSEILERIQRINDQRFLVWLKDFGRATR
jgi:hypothetical protein